MVDGYSIRFTPRASDDLVAIFEYIKADSPQNAAGVVQTLLDAIDSLAILPRRHKVHRLYRDPGRSVRAMTVAPFVVYYRVKEEH